jgi:hypothetical protein
MTDKADGAFAGGDDFAAAHTHVSPGMQANVSDEIERLLDGKK